MKKFNRSQSVLFLALLMALTTFYSCSKDDNNPVDPNNVTNSAASLTLNGAGYTNKAATLGNGLGGYSLPDTMTVLQFSGKVDNDSLYLGIIFKANHTGTFNWDNDNGAIIYRTTSTGDFLYYGISQGSTTVSNYGSVNGKIEGTINGKLIEQSSLAELNISGSFSALRIPDSQ